MNERVIFDAALKIAAPQARRAFIEKSCAGNPGLLAAVAALLKSHDAAGSFLNVPVAEQMLPVPASGSDSTDPSQPSEVFDKTRVFQSGMPGDDDSDDESQPDLSFLQPSSKPGSIGLLGHYEILQVLGQGGSGIVLKAFDEKLHRHVAIKVMNAQMAATSPPRKRFLREARAAAAIRHENIVQVYSVEEQPLPYLVMEFIDGQTLQQKQAGHGPLDVPELLHIGRQLAAGLAAAHATGLIHRDIKPGNILLEQGAEQKVKITDFGLARAADDASLSRSGTISGTPMYMAPEQALGQTLDHRADLFSLGSVLYELATGRPPFRAANTVAVLRRVVDDTPRPMQEIIPELPDWLVAIVNKLLAKNPEERFQSSKEVADLLGRCQSELQLTGQVTCVNVDDARRGPVDVRRGSPDPAETLDRRSPALQDGNAVARHPQGDLRSSGSAGSGDPRTTKGESPAEPFARTAALRWFIAASVITFAVITGLILKPWQNEARRMAAPGRPFDTQPNTKKTAEGGHPTKALGWHGWPADAPKPAIAPFNAEQAQQHQEEWAVYLKVPVECTNSLGMKFRLIPPAEFTMGSTKEEIAEALKSAKGDPLWQECIQSEGPRHQVILTQPTYLGVYEVTQGQYEHVIGTNSSRFGPMGTSKEAITGMDTTIFPVERVSWKGATEFCVKLGEAGMRVDETAYRLPTEGEWEFACRAGTTTEYWFGENVQDRLQAAWFYTNSSDRTHAVGELKDNPFGLFDIHGNVWEWVQDAWDPTFYQQFQQQPAIDPLKPSVADSPHVTRGGNWSSSISSCRTASRCPETAAYPGTLIGFRVVLTVDAVRKALKVTGPALPKSVATTPSAPGIDFAAERQAAEWVRP